MRGPHQACPNTANETASSHQHPISTAILREAPLLSNWFSGLEQGSLIKGSFTERISRLSEISNISRSWSDYPGFPPVRGISNISKFSKISKVSGIYRICRLPHCMDTPPSLQALCFLSFLFSAPADWQSVCHSATHLPQY